MAFYRRSELSARARRRVAATGEAPGDVLSRMDATASITRTFDIFLSHSYLNKSEILEIVKILEEARLSVYVDWIVDHQRDRLEVTRETAELLRQRMTQCTWMIFAASTSSPTSKWMPWELGFFDGQFFNTAFGDRIFIMPIDDSTPGEYGQEYLELYPAIEKIEAFGRAVTAAVSVNRQGYLPLRDLAVGKTRYRSFGGL